MFNYQPDVFLAQLAQKLGANSLSQLGRKIGISGGVLSKIQHSKLPISATLILQIHETTGFPIKELRHWMGDERRMFFPIKRNDICALKNDSLKNRKRNRLIRYPTLMQP